MEENRCIFIKNAVFFESRSKKHKPVFVQERDFHSLTYRYKGKVVISCNGRTYTSQAGSITYMPKGMSYTTEIIEDVSIAAVHFDFDCENNPQLPTVLQTEDGVLPSLFKALAKSTKDTSASFSGMSVLYEILAKLEEISSNAVLRCISEKMERAMEIIEENSLSQDFSVTLLAERLGMSTAYLRREFNKAYGMPPGHCIRKIRISKAKQLLLTEHLTIEKIAEGCGYGSASYFIQDFHKYTGESPGSYRKRMFVSP